jgi:hypothetical protein
MVPDLNKDKLLGFLLITLSPAFLLIYGWLLFLSPFEIITLEITVFLIIAALLVVFAWVGYTVAIASLAKPTKIQAEKFETVESNENSV